MAAGDVKTQQWLTQIGCWGFAFSCVQMLLLERSQLAAVTWSFQVLCRPSPAHCWLLYCLRVSPL